MKCLTILTLLQSLAAVFLSFILSSCQNSIETASAGEPAEKSVIKAANASNQPLRQATRLAAPWQGIIPEKAYFTTDFIIHNITVIDSDPSMFSEISWGLKQINNEVAQNKTINNQTGFAVQSADHAFLLLDNSFYTFKDTSQVTVVDQAIDKSNLAETLQAFIQSKIDQNPNYAAQYVASITIITDGDISINSAKTLEEFLQKTFPEGHLYVHLIGSLNSGNPVNSWCEPVESSPNLIRLQAIAQKSLVFSICDPNWHGDFRAIGKRVIYDHAFAKLNLPARSHIAGKKPFVRFDGQALPPDLVGYNEVSRQITMRLTDMPSRYQAIEIGFAP